MVDLGGGDATSGRALAQAEAAAAFSKKMRAQFETTRDNLVELLAGTSVISGARLTDLLNSFYELGYSAGSSGETNLQLDKQIDFFKEEMEQQRKEKAERDERDEQERNAAHARADAMNAQLTRIADACERLPEIAEHLGGLADYLLEELEEPEEEPEPPPRPRSR